MKPKVYLDTSVISYLTAPLRKEARAAAFQQATRQWFAAQAGQFDLFTSQLVADEAAAGNRERARERKVVIDRYPRLRAALEVKGIACPKLSTPLEFLE